MNGKRCVCGVYHVRTIKDEDGKRVGEVGISHDEWLIGLHKEFYEPRRRDARSAIWVEGPHAGGPLDTDWPSYYDPTIGGRASV